MGALVNDTALASIVSFLVLAYLLSRLAWKPLRELMVARQQRIASALEEAAGQREEAERLRSQLEVDRQNARDEAQRLLERVEKTAITGRPPRKSACEDRDDDDKRVHPCLRRIPVQVRVRRHQSRRRNPSPPVEERPGRPVAGRNRRERN